MRKLAAMLFLVLALVPTRALCDWHDHFGHIGSHGQASSDPEIDYFVSTVLLIIAASGAILFLAGPVLVFWTRRTRHIFWIVPLAYPENSSRFQRDR